jgi:hypothetical protein
MLPAPTVTELAVFTGRPEGTFPPFSGQALAQAALLFQTITKRTAYPDDEAEEQLARYAILEMADRLVLEQPYAQVKSNPFQSESILSYSYSKATPTSARAAMGGKTGLSWWDLAIDELTLPGASVIGYGSIYASTDGLYRTAEGDYYVDSGTDDIDRPPYIRIS